jgi:3-deoxy-D-manno-octulosonic-acid transferase
LPTFFYQFFLWLYQSGIRLLSPWNRKAKKWLEGRKDIFTQVKSVYLAGRDTSVWMHCASIGEFEQGRPVLERIKGMYPGLKTIVTFFSPTGYDLKKNDPCADFVFYLPADSRKNAELFISAISPKLVLWVKHEYWYFYLEELEKRKIPTLLLSANFRPDQPFFRWYGRIYRKMLGCFTHIFVQTEASQKLISSIIPREKASIGGDTRFDRVIEIAEHGESIQSVEHFCGSHPVIVAGGTSDEDEEELSHYANSHPEIRFLIAPCFIDEEHLKDSEKLFKRCIRYSVLSQVIDIELFMKESPSRSPSSSGKWSTSNQEGIHRVKEKEEGPSGPPNVLLVDTMGILSALYRYGHIAYVGGGFEEGGVHNVLEAAVYGRPVVMGPVIEKYVEAVELVELGGGTVIESALEAEEAFNLLFEDADRYQSSCQISRKYVYSRRGATERIIKYIQENRLLTN